MPTHSSCVWAQPRVHKSLVSAVLSSMCSLLEKRPAELQQVQSAERGWADLDLTSAAHNNAPIV